MEGQLKIIAETTIKSRLQPGDDGSCVSMILSVGKNPAWYSLPCHIEERDYICKRLSETVLLPLPNHVITSAYYSKCDVQELYAINKCYLILDQAIRSGTNVVVDIDVSVRDYIMHLLQSLNAVTSMKYQLQIQKSHANMIDSSNHLCILIASRTFLSSRNTIQSIKVRKCVPMKASKTFYVFAGRNLKRDCKSNQVLCNDGTCISQTYFCFDYISCSSKNCACRNETQLVYDEHYCRYLCAPQSCLCPPHHFQCGSRGCIQFTLICDGKPDCDDSSDEMCGYITRLTSQPKGHDQTEILYTIGHGVYCLGYQCSSGECISLRYVNDLIPDCPGGQAEDEHLFLRMFYHEEHFDCADKSYHPCAAGLPVCFPLVKLCLFDSDEEQNILWCRNGAHLGDCTDINCTNSYKCNQSYCIPIHRVCNGKADCIHGEDEHMCDDYICKGLLRCKGHRICVHPDQICDGTSHCPNNDDEGFCDWRSCALNCTCVGYSMICTSLVDETLPPLQSDYTKYMSVSRSYMPNPHFHNICYQSKLVYLNLSDNHIHDICSSLYSDCELYKNIFLLDLSHNMIETLEPSCFKKMTSLKVILLAHNNLQVIHGDAFLGLSLEYLNIKYTKITEITEQSMHDISNIRVFDMCDIHLNYMDQFAENTLSHIPELIFNDPRFCCILPDAKICQKQVNVVGSCPTILPHRHMGYFSIVVGCCVVFMNTIGLIVNVKLFKGSLHAEAISYLMSVNIVLGAYLPIIGSVDIYYGQRIVFLHANWSDSILCSLMELSTSVSLLISWTLNGLLMFMTVGAVTRVKFHIVKTRLALGILLMTVFAIIINLMPSLIKEKSYDKTDSPVSLCNILDASALNSLPRRVSEGIICIMMVLLFIYVFYGAIKVISYISKTSREVMKFSEGETSKNNSRKIMMCKRMVELVLAMSFITLPYPLLKTISIWYVDITRTSYVGVMFSTIILETIYTPVSYIYQPLLSRICKRCDWSVL